MTDVNDGGINGITLLPCPFCGGEAELRHNKTWDYEVRCVDCRAKTRQHHENKNGAIGDWNTRAERTCRVDIRERRLMHQYWNECVCSECDSSFWMNETFFPMPLYCPNCRAKVTK